MALTNTQYELLKQTYDQRQQKNRNELIKRKDHIFRLIPRMKELDERISECAVTAVERMINGDNTARNECHRLFEQYEKEKQHLLTQAGYSKDYLSPIYDCKDCRDTGYQYTDSGLTKKCHCYQQLVSEILLADSGRGVIPPEDTFENFQYDYYSEQYIDDITEQSAYQNAFEVVETARRYVRDFDRSDHKNLFIYGSVGIGKTYLTHCIMNEMKKNNKVFFYLTAFEFFDLAREHSFSRDDDEQTATQYHDLVTCDILIIDDLGSELNNSFTNTQLYSVINERMIQNLATIISTNLSLNDIRSIYGERIFSRISGSFELIRMFGDDIRIKKRY